MKRAALAVGVAMLPAGWAFAAAPLGMIGHMAGHMTAVALAAPLLAYGLSDGPADPAHRWPWVVTPMAMMLVELAVVWSWHLPALRTAAQGSLLVLAVEQACFLGSGLLLWSAVLHRPQRAAGIGALLLTSMHMTLLGVLIGLAPRPLYLTAHHLTSGMDALIDQQLGGVVMLLIGAVSYFVGGLMLLGSLISQREPA